CGRYVVKMSNSSSVATPMRSAASRSARTGSVHHAQRDKGHGSQGLKPTTVGVFMAGRIPSLREALGVTGDRGVALQRLVIGVRGNERPPTGYLLHVRAVPAAPPLVRRGDVVAAHEQNDLLRLRPVGVVAQVAGAAPAQVGQGGVPVGAQLLF